MPLEVVVAAIGLLGVITYAILAGADFGGGIWDLLAWGPRRTQQREAIAHAVGPVWEANHVWLIFIIVVLFTGFPTAFAALSVGLFAPFHLALLGIILRGAAFVFRAYSPQSEQKPSQSSQRWGTIFGAASVITPVILGMALSAVSAGQLRVIDGVVQSEGIVWLTPLAIAMGLLALALCAYLAAVYMTLETRDELQADFRQRALLAGTAVVGLSLLSLPLLYFTAQHLWEGLISLRAAPVLTIGVLAALLSGWALLRWRFQLARGAAIVQISCLLAGWGIAQYPYIIYPDVTLAAAAAPRATLIFILVALPLGLLILLPSLWFLFKVFKSAPIEDL